MTARTPPSTAERLGNPGKRPIVRLPVAAGVDAPPPPRHLGQHGREAWTTAYSTGWVMPTDAAIVTLLADALDRRAALLADLATTGMLTTGSTGQLVAHPLVGIVMDTERDITRYASLLGLTPSDRLRLGVEGGRNQVSALDRIRAGKASW